MRGCLYFFRKFESYFDASCWLSRQKVLKTASQPFYSKKHHFPSERLNFLPRHCSPQHYFASFDFFLIFRLFEHFSFLAFTLDFWILIFFTYLNISALWSFHRSLWSNRRLRRRVCWSWRSVELRQFHSLGSQRSPPQGSQRKLLFLFLRRIVSSL